MELNPTLLHKEVSPLNSHVPTPVSQVVVDLASNTLTLHPQTVKPVEPGIATQESAILDMGIKGHLIGIELEPHYFAVSESDGANDDLVRSSEVIVTVIRTREGEVQSVAFPRLGSTYEVTFPIGNQCWRQTVNGEIVESCVVTIGR
jgi:hypothetical protein